MNLTNKFGSNESDEIKATNIAIAVKIPKSLVGKKFDNARIENPAAIVAAV